jgi:hypothetical protein
LIDELLMGFLNFIRIGKMYLLYNLLPAHHFFISLMKAQNVIPLYNGAIPNSRPAPDEENSRYEQDSILIVSRVSHPS